MAISLSSSADLASVAGLMRELSRQSDPQAAAELYGSGLRKLNLFPSDRYLSLSRRGLDAPRFRITRNSSWKSQPDPWRESEKLPLLSGGILAEILYSNEPAIVRDLSSRLTAGDPAREQLGDMNLLIALPHFDGGEAINAGILLKKDADDFPFDSIPMMLWQANLWGRATLNLVTQQKLRAAYQSLDRELKVVGEIQKSLLPRELPAIAGVDIAAHYHTSQRAGGDYYDFFPLPGGRWGIFVADVSGHGTPAAVMMAITHAIVHSRPGHPMPPTEVLGYLNKQLSTFYTRGTGTFITALYGVLDPKERTLVYASAGHPGPRLIRGGTSLAIEDEPGFPLGVEVEERYAESTLPLESGDRLVLFTDGIPECFGASGELFGAERMDAAIRGAGMTAKEVVDGVLAAVERFTGGGALTDDRTLLGMVFH